MKKEYTRNLRLGIFVAIGTFFLIISLYMIGSKRNLFGSKVRINALFDNVNGLVSGNNVRYSGMDVGTVESVEIINDTAIKVVMIIERSIQRFIKKNSIAAVGTDGLMGNKIVNISSVSAPSKMIEEGDILETLRPIDTDLVMRTLNTTNQNVEAITNDLRNIARKINNSNTLWSLLLDTVVAQNVKQAIVSIKISGNNTAEITGDLAQITQSIKEGNGSIGALLMDTSLSGKLEQTIVNIRLTSERSATISGNLDKIVRKINQGEGTIGKLVMDTMLIEKLNKSMENIQKGTEGFSENMEALKQVPFIRKYFRKQAKEQKAKN